MFRLHESNIPQKLKHYYSHSKAKKKFAKTWCQGEPLGVVLWEIDYIENL